MSDLQARLATLSPAERERLRGRLAALRVPAAPAVTPPAEPLQDDHSLSPAQWRMWLFEQREGSGAAYNIVSVLRLHGALDVGALDWALQQTLRRHESLRTVFVEEGGQVRRAVIDEARVALTTIDAPQLGLEPEELEPLVAALAAEPLPLATAPLMRVTLLRVAPLDHVLVSVLHHIAADGWSLRLLERDIGRLYDERLAGRREIELPHAVSYGEFVAKQRSWEAMQRAAEQLKYWERRLCDMPQRLRLPVDETAPGRRSLECRSHLAHLDAQWVAAAQSLAERYSVSVFMLLGAAFNVVLSWLSGQQDICIGTPVANRRDSRFDEVVGLFSNTVVLRSTVARTQAFASYLADFKHTCLEAIARQEVPFEQVVEALRGHHLPTNAPPFQVLFVLHATEASALHLRGLQVAPVQLPRQFSDFEIMLEVSLESGGGCAMLSAQKDLFSADTGQQVLRSWVALLERAVCDPHLAINTLCAGLAGAPTGIPGSTVPSDVTPDAVVPRAAASDRTAFVHAGQSVTAADAQALIEAAGYGLQVAARSENRVVRASNLLDYYAGLAAVLNSGLRVLVPESDVSSQRLYQARERLDHDVVLLHPRAACDTETAAPSRAALGATQDGLREQGEFLLLTTTQEARIAAATLLERIEFLERSIKIETTARCFIPGGLPLEASLHILLWLWTRGRTACFGDATLDDRPAADSSEWRRCGATVAFLQPGHWRELLTESAAGTQVQLDAVILLGEHDAPREQGCARRLYSLWANLHDGPVLIEDASSHRIATSGRVLALSANAEPLPEHIVGELAVVSATEAGKQARIGIRGRLTAHGVERSRVHPAAWIDGRSMDLRAVERALLRHPAVSDVCVLPRIATDGRAQVVAYVALARDVAVDALAEFVRNVLGSGAVPTAFVRASCLPYAADGCLAEELLIRSPVVDDSLCSYVNELCRWLPDPGAQVCRELQSRAPARLKVLREDAAPPATAARSDPFADQSAEEGAVSIAHGSPLRQAGEPRTLIDMIRTTVERYGGKQIIHLLDADGSEQRETYAELFAGAQQVLGALAAAGVRRGDRVLLQLPRNADMLRGFWACVLGGIVPIAAAVPVQYDAQDKDGAKLINAWGALDIRAVLTDSTTRDALELLRHALQAEQLMIVTIDAVGSGPATLHRPEPDEVALLLLTSGSTGVPKAVMQSHGALVSRSIATAQQHGFDADVVSFNWMPLDHVGGLVMYHLLDVYLGAEQVHCPSALILAAPLRWLDWLSRYRVTSTWAPNFAFALVNDRLEATAPGSWDLRALGFILNGGEAIVPRTARTFLRKLAPYGLAAGAMKPAWGMSETCSGITFNRDFGLAAGSDTDAFVEVGRPIPGVQARIVDEHGRAVPQGRVGRLQVRGAPITLGYFNNADATRQSLDADGWFTTGDLATMRAESITITGREKDLIIINGLNYHGHELEQIVERVPGIRAAHVAACAVRLPSDDTDRLAVFFSVDTQSKSPDSCRAVRTALLQQARVYASYLIELPGEALPRTAIGKIQRAQLAERFSRGEFRELVWSGESEALPESADWHFEPCWVRRNARGPARELRCLLLVGDGVSLAAYREVRGALAVRAVYVESAAHFGRSGTDSFTFRAEVPADLQRILSLLTAEGCTPDTFIYSAAVAARPDDVAHELRTNASGVLGLVQAMVTVQAELPAECALFVVTHAAFAIEPADTVNPCAHAMLGMVRSLSYEAPWLKCCHIDLSTPPHPAGVASLFASLRSCDKDDVIGLRPSGRYVCRLRSVFPAHLEVRPRRFHGAACYVITGGLGGIGVHLVRHLLSCPDSAVLVLGRTSAQELCRARPDLQLHAKAAAYLELSGHGARFAYEQVDVCDAAALRGAIDRSAAFWSRPLAAVFHLAGELDEALLTEVEPSALLARMAVKITGADVLQQALASRPDTEVHLFSSANGFFGGLGVTAYATANAYLDGFAAAQRSRGRRWFSYGWSMWDETGMSRGYQLKQRTVARGFCLLRPEHALMSLRVLAGRAPASVLVGLDSANLHVAAHLAHPFQPLDVLSIRTAVAADVTALQEIRAPDRFGVVVTPQVRLVDEAACDMTGLPATPQAPQSDLERKLAALWSDLLGKQVVQRDANFFELGGDSIMAIQLAARAHQSGLALRPRQIFETQTLRELAAACVAAEPPDGAEQGLIVGEIPLAPIQRWFFEQRFSEAQHMNQSVLLRVKQPLDKRRLEAALHTLLARHDILRARYEERGGATRQVLVAAANVVVAEDHMPCTMDGIDHAALADRASAVQAGLDLERAPLLRVVYFKAQRLEDERLLLVLHHLVVDGVSWRILLDDLESIYEAPQSVPASPQPAKTASYRQWAQWCEQHALASERDVEYWSASADLSACMLAPGKAGDNTRVHEASVEFALDAITTERLLARASATRPASMEHLLLGALFAAWREWRGQESWYVTLEGHGRDESASRLNLSRTIGWFTSLYPVLFTAGGHCTPDDLIERVAATLSQVPQQGLSYLMLRYCGPPQTQLRLARQPWPSVSFNYLGRFDVTGERRFAFATESPGRQVAAAQQRVHELDIVGCLVDRQLQWSFVFSGARHERQHLQRLAALFERELRALAGARAAAELIAVSRATAQRIQASLSCAAECDAETVMPATPMQTGLLYESQVSKIDGIYVSQLVNEIEGTLDPAALRAAWQLVVARHAVYRTAFAADDAGRFLQIVQRHAVLPWSESDWCAFGDAERERRFAALLEEDARRGFDLGRPPLLRIHLVKLAARRHRLLISEHHAVSDGWSRGIVLRELATLYRALRRGATHGLPPAPAFKSYIEWFLERRNESSRQYWSAYLREAHPMPSLAYQAGEAGRSVARYQRTFSAQLSARLAAAARMQRTTVGALLQAAWAAVLSSHTGRDDVMFLTTHSGRPGELRDVEHIVGPFVNTVPVRAQLSAESSVLDCARRLQRHQVELTEHGHLTLGEICRLAGDQTPQELVNTLFVVENFPLTVPERTEQDDLAVVEVRSLDRTEFPLAVMAVPGACLELVMYYRTGSYSHDAVEQLSTHFAAALEYCSGHPRGTVHGQGWMPQADRAAIRAKLAERAMPAGQSAPANEGIREPTTVVEF